MGCLDLIPEAAGASASLGPEVRVTICVPGRVTLQQWAETLEGSVLAPVGLKSESD